MAIDKTRCTDASTNDDKSLFVNLAGKWLLVEFDCYGKMQNWFLVRKYSDFQNFLDAGQMSSSHVMVNKVSGRVTISLIRRTAMINSVNVEVRSEKPLVKEINYHTNLWYLVWSGHNRSSSHLPNVVEASEGSMQSNRYKSSTFNEPGGRQWRMSVYGCTADCMITRMGTFGIQKCILNKVPQKKLVWKEGNTLAWTWNCTRIKKLEKKSLYE